jgi:hypothetical protein
MWRLGCTQEQADQAPGGVVLRAWGGVAQASRGGAPVALVCPQPPASRLGRLSARGQQPQGACLQADAPALSPTISLPNSVVHSESTHNASIVQHNAIHR